MEWRGVEWSARGRERAWMRFEGLTSIETAVVVLLRSELSSTPSFKMFSVAATMDTVLPCMMPLMLTCGTSTTTRSAKMEDADFITSARMFLMVKTQPGALHCRRAPSRITSTPSCR